MGDTDEVEIRRVAEDEAESWWHAEALGFGNRPPTAEQLALERAVTELDRSVGAFADGRVVGTAGVYSFQLTLPGGATVPVGGVTGVTVQAPFRRRGILRRMVDRILDDGIARGEAASILNASEGVIYGRFGYGVADYYQQLAIERHRATFARPVPERRFRVLRREEARDAVPPVYEACRLSRPGLLDHSPAWWDCVFGPQATWKGGGDVFVVVADPVGDDPGGFATWTTAPADDEEGMRLSVRHLVAATADTEAALWRFLTSVDLAVEVVAEARPLDDGLRWWLTDARRPRVTKVQDYLWVRPLDLEGLLAARRYRVADAVVLEVIDDVRPELAGRYRVEGGPDGAACTRTDAPPDLALSAAAVGSLSLGGIGAHGLAGAGRIEGRTPGAVDRADLFFGWPVAPHCITRF